MQVTVDPVGQKGAALDTDISVAGRYLVLRPFDENRRVSRKVEDDQARRRVIERVAGFLVPAETMLRHRLAVGNRGLSNDRLFAALTVIIIIIIIIWAAGAVVFKAQWINFLLSIDPIAKSNCQ